MKIKTEVRIGIIVLATFLLVFWGINYLKGRNLLKKTDVYYAVFNNVQGLDPSSSVLLNGYKIGLINTIDFDKGSLTDIIVSFSVNHQFDIPKSSVVELISSDLLGSKALQIIPSNSSEYHVYGDTLSSSIKEDIFSSISNEFIPLKESAETLMLNLDSVVHSLSVILNTETIVSIQKSFANLEITSQQLSEQLSSGDLRKMLNSLAGFSSSLNNNKDKLDSIFYNVENISDSLASANILSLINSANESFMSIAQLLEYANSGQGSLGKFSQDDSLYVNLNSSMKSLDLLLKDLQENPKRYVHFSVFGGKNKDE